MIIDDIDMLFVFCQAWTMKHMIDVMICVELGALEHMGE